MAFTWKVTNDDLTINDGKFEIVSKKDEVAQRLKTALLHEYDEYFLNYTNGVPWYQSILGSRNTKNAELIFRKIALDVPGVISVIGLNTNTSNGRTTVALTAEVQDGDYISSTVTTNISGQLIGE
jgi:hypothetical protein